MTRHRRPSACAAPPTWPAARPARRPRRRHRRPTRRSSAAAPSRTRPSATRPARSSTTSAPAATPPSARPTRASVAAGRTAGSSSIRRELARGAGRACRHGVRRALDQAIANVRRFAETQRPATTRTDDRPRASRSSGAGRRSTAVGAYVPGGSAPYPSSLVMTVVPARVAGVGRIVVASPADRDGAHRPGPARRRRAARGRRASSSPAAPRRSARSRYGLPDAGARAGRPDRRARQRLGDRGQDRGRGDVGIDLPAGPSEGMVLADAAGRPGRVAADLSPRPSTARTRRPSSSRRTPAFADAVEAEVDALARRRPPRRDILERALARPRPDRPRAGPRRGDRLRQRLRARAPVGRRRAARADGRAAPQRRLALRRPVGARVGRRLRDGRQPRPADRRPGPRRPAALAVEAYGKFIQVQRVDREGLAGIRETVAHAGRGRGPARPPRRRRDPLRGPTPPDEPDARDLQPRRPRPPPTPGRRPTRRSRRATASRSSDDRPVRPEHVPGAARARGRGSWRPVAFETPLSEYPPSDYRRLVAAAAARYGVGTGRAARRRRRGRDPRPRRQGVPRRRARRPSSRPRRTRCTASSPSSAAPTVVAVPRLGRGRGLGARPRRRPRGRRATPRSSGCAARTTRRRCPEPDGAIERLLAGLAADAAGGRPRRRRSSSSTRPTPSSSARRSLGLRDALPEPRSSSGRRARPTPSPGCGSGSRSPGPSRSPGSPRTGRRARSRRSRSRSSTEALLRRRRSSTPTSTASRASATASPTALREAGWSVGPSVTNFLLVDFGTPERAAAARRGPAAPRPRAADVPGRAIRSPHCLRLTVRDPDENDRLIAAAGDLARETDA